MVIALDTILCCYLPTIHDTSSIDEERRNANGVMDTREMNENEKIKGNTSIEEDKANAEETERW